MKQKALSILLILGLPLLVALSLAWSVSGARAERSANSPVSDLEVDLAVQLTSQPRPAIAGGVITYTVVVTSSELEPVTAVTLTLDIDAQVDELTYMPAQGAYTTTTGIWSGFQLSITAPITMTVVGQVNPGASGFLTTTVTVLPTGASDPIGDNNLATDVNPVIQIADLSIDKIAAPAVAVAGQLLTYTLTAANSGPSAAANVVLTDTLPAQVEFVSVDNASCETILDQTVLVCSWETLDAATVVEVTLIVEVDLLATGSLLNMAEISSDTDDPNLDDNNVTLATPVTAVAADLSVSKTANASSVIAGETLTYTITVTNAGPAAATQIVLTDTLPAAVSVVTAPPNCVANNGVLICPVGDLAAGQATDFDLVVAVAPDARNSLTNAVTVSSTEIDPHPANNSDTAVTPVTAEASLSLDKTVQPAVVVGHAPFTYTLVVTNSGPTAALNTTLTDSWPAGLSLVSAPPNCALAGGAMTCNLGLLLPNQQPITLDIVARSTTVNPTDNVVFTNSAIVTSDAGSSNTATVNVTVTPYRLFLPTIIKPKEWQQVGTVPTGVTAFYDIVACNDQMFVGASNGIYRWQANNWQRQTSGPDGIVLQLAFANDLCDRIYAASFGGGIWLGTRSGSSWNWNQVNATLSLARAVVIRGDTLFAAGDFGLYSASVANHAFAPTTITTAVNGLTIDRDGVTIFATVWNNGVFTNSGGTLWTKQGTVTNPLVWRAVGDGNGDPLLVGTETGLNLWHNGNWTAVAPGYNSRTRAVAAIDTALYAAQLGRGVIVSYNNGLSWQPMNAGLPVSPTAEYYSLRTFDDGYLYVTAGTGIWRWPLP